MLDLNDNIKNKLKNITEPVDPNNKQITVFINDAYGSENGKAIIGELTSDLFFDPSKGLFTDGMTISAFYANYAFKSVQAALNKLTFYRSAQPITYQMVFTRNFSISGAVERSD